MLWRRSFDVGDVLLLGNGEWHQVEAIALQATTLLRWDGVKVCAAPGRHQHHSTFIAEALADESSTIMHKRRGTSAN